MPLIRAEHLAYEYLLLDEEQETEEKKTALKGLDFSVEKGEYIAILGRNGSGKSTLARHINALLFPTEGTVWVKDMRTDDESRLWDIRSSAGMVFQNPDNQIVATVVEEDVGFGPENIGVPTEEIWQRVRASLQAVGMGEKGSSAPHRLSGGQKQRVAIAGVLAMEPECIVFDEATAMLDPKGRREVLEAIQKLNQEKGITVLLITHYMEEAALAGRIMVMDQGSLVMDGTPRDIFSRSEDLKALGLTVPPVTALADRLIEAGLPLPKGIHQETQLVQAVANLYKGRGETHGA